MKARQEEECYKILASIRSPRIEQEKVKVLKVGILRLLFIAQKLLLEANRRISRSILLIAYTE